MHNQYPFILGQSRFSVSLTAKDVDSSVGIQIIRKDQHSAYRASFQFSSKELSKADEETIQTVIADVKDHHGTEVMGSLDVTRHGTAEKLSASKGTTSVLVTTAYENEDNIHQIFNSFDQFSKLQKFLVSCYAGLFLVPLVGRTEEDVTRKISEEIDKYRQKGKLKPKDTLEIYQTLKESFKALPAKQKKQITNIFALGPRTRTMSAGNLECFSDALADKGFLDGLVTNLNEIIPFVTSVVYGQNPKNPQEFIKCRLRFQPRNTPKETWDSVMDQMYNQAKLLHKAFGGQAVEHKTYTSGEREEITTTYLQMRIIDLIQRCPVGETDKLARKHQKTILSMMKALFYGAGKEGLTEVFKVGGNASIITMIGNQLFNDSPHINPAFSLLEILEQSNALLELSDRDDPLQRTPLHKAVVSGDLQKVKELQKKYKDGQDFKVNIETGSDSGQDKTYEIYTTLAQFAVNIQDIDGDTPLHLALKGQGSNQKRKIDIVQEICPTVSEQTNTEIRPDFSLQDKDGNTVIHLAIKLANEQNDDTILAHLLENCQTIDQSMNSVGSSSTGHSPAEDDDEKFQPAAIDLSKKDKDGNTILHLLYDRLIKAQKELGKAPKEEKSKFQEEIKKVETYINFVTPHVEKDAEYLSAEDLRTIHTEFSKLTGFNPSIQNNAGDSIINKIREANHLKACLISFYHPDVDLKPVDSDGYLIFRKLLDTIIEKSKTDKDRHPIRLSKKSVDDIAEDYIDLLKKVLGNIDPYTSYSALATVNKNDELVEAQGEVSDAVFNKYDSFFSNESVEKARIRYLTSLFKEAGRQVLLTHNIVSPNKEKEFATHLRDAFLKLPDHEQDELLPNEKLITEKDKTKIITFLKESFIEDEAKVWVKTQGKTEDSDSKPNNQRDKQKRDRAQTSSSGESSPNRGDHSKDKHQHKRRL